MIITSSKRITNHLGNQFNFDDQLFLMIVGNIFLAVS